jgi:DNA-binding CsgD family transcriptional regulator
MVDIVLYGSCAQPESDDDEIRVLKSARPASCGLYLELPPRLIESGRKHGVQGHLSKALPARDLVAALEAIHAGEVVISEPLVRARSIGGLDWPGRSEGLTDRESEILTLITQGKSNAEVATLTYLSPNTVKSYIRTIYRKSDVASGTRAFCGGFATASRRPSPHRTLARRALTRPGVMGKDQPCWVRVGVRF